MAHFLTRVATFHATHRYHKPAWSEVENRRRFGAARDLHGHAYRLEVTVTGPLDPETQMLVDLAALDQAIHDEILTCVAGRDLSDAVARFAPGGELPTCEGIAEWCWERLHARLPDTVQLTRVRVAEDATLWADCTGPS